MDTFFKSRGRGHVTPLVVSEVLSASILPHETYPRLPTLLLPLTATKFEPQRVLLAQQQRTTHLSTTRNSLNHRQSSLLKMDMRRKQTQVPYVVDLKLESGDNRGCVRSTIVGVICNTIMCYSTCL
jgi:hypothetical protein